MADARRPHLIEHLRRRIGLDRVERVARKGIEETLRRHPELLRVDGIDRLDRLHLGDEVVDAGKAGKRFGAGGPHIHGRCSFERGEARPAS